jgi:hypothetical protein
MHLYLFFSVTHKNIRIGIDQQLWAVAPTVTRQHAKARRTRAENMPVGSAGLFYAADEQVFTTPFVVESEVEDRTVFDVWDGPWCLPFKIRPLGTTANVVTWREATITWPFVRNARNRGGLVTGLRTFAPIEVPRPEWNEMLVRFHLDPELYDDLFQDSDRVARP